LQQIIAAQHLPFLRCHGTNSKAQKEVREMNFAFNKLATGAVDQTLMVAETVVGLGRAAAEGTAQVMLKAKTPLRNAANAGIKINDITHRGVTRLVKVQAKALERSVDAGAARFKLAAKAPSVRALIKTQLELLPATRARLEGNLRDTWTVVTETGSEFGTLFYRKKPASKGKRKSKTTRARRKPVAKKAAARKKATAGKTTRGARVVRKTSTRRRKAA
jgi:hypothetical protein